MNARKKNRRMNERHGISLLLFSSSCSFSSFFFLFLFRSEGNHLFTVFTPYTYSLSWMLFTIHIRILSTWKTKRKKMSQKIQIKCTTSAASDYDERDGEFFSENINCKLYSQIISFSLLFFPFSKRYDYKVSYDIDLCMFQIVYDVRAKNVLFYFRFFVERWNLIKDFRKRTENEIKCEKKKHNRNCSILFWIDSNFLVSDINAFWSQV